MDEDSSIAFKKLKNIKNKKKWDASILSLIISKNEQQTKIKVINKIYQTKFSKKKSYEQSFQFTRKLSFFFNKKYDFSLSTEVSILISIYNIL